MASLPNRVYPQTEFREIRADVIRAATKVYGASVNFSTVNSSIPSGSMSSGDFVLVTGSSGTSALLYFAVRSGSGYAIYSITGTYVSSGSNP